MQIEPREEDYNGPKTEGNNKLIGLLYAAYFRWSKFVVHCRFAIIIFCSIISTLGAIKIANTPFANNIMGFTPYGARSLAESAIHDQFFNSTDGKGAFGVFLLLKPKKEGQNILKKEMLEEAIRIDDLVNWNITIQNHGLNKSEPFAEFCRDFCNINEPFRLFWQGFQQNVDDLDQNNAQLNVELNYPTINVFGRKMNIQPHFHGIKFVNRKKAKGHQIESNMNFVEMIGLIYREQRINGLSDEEVKEYEIKVSKFFEREFKSDLVRVLSISTSYVEAEFVRANLSMLPFLGIGLTIMLICTSICFPLSAAYFQQASIHKISLAIVACICPFMATGTALGLLFLCGLRFSPILCATPFLVLAIGVDDAYLMSHAWNRLAKKCNFQKIVQKGENSAENEEDEKIVANLLAMVLMDSGPAILISALANICADAIGAFIGSPEITILCVGNATALAFDFLFQCTYFVAVMATIGLIERKEMRKKLTKKENEQNGIENSKKNISEEGWQKYFHDSLKTFVAKFVDFYTNSICNQICAIFILLCSTIFIVFSIFAITKFEVEMSTKELYSQDSPLLEIDNIRENRINPFYTQATVFINNFGDLSNKSRIAEIDKFVEEFEHLNESWGPQSSMFFLRDLREYLLAKKNEENEEEGNEIGKILNGKSSNESVISDILHCQTLIDFLDEAEYSHWKGFIRLNGIMDENEANSSFSSKSSSCPSIQRFFFTTAYHNPKLFKWSERVELLRKWRKIVDENAKTIDASVYHEEGIYLDLMDNMPTDTWQSAVATLICMATICLFLLHDLRTVLVTTLVIAIIITETMGILSISGVALNQLMMGSLVISIGFSVDLPAHFSFHFLTSDESKDSSTKSKLVATIRAVGLPSVQASLSTSLCVLSHYWIKLYIAQIFVRIICLTICLCLLNTLVVLPALLFLIGSIGTNLKEK